MRNLPLQFFVLLCFLASCRNSRESNIYILEVENSKPQTINLAQAEERITFNDSFWVEFIDRFPQAAVTLFSSYNRDSTIPNIQLSDERYTYVNLFLFNRFKLVNQLPKNLSKEESENYWSSDGFFIKVDILKTGNKRDYEWHPASKVFEKDYDRFFRLIKDHKKDHILVIRRDLKNELEGKI